MIVEASIIPVSKLTYTLGAIEQNERIRNVQTTEMVSKAKNLRKLREDHDELIIPMDTVSSASVLSE